MSRRAVNILGPENGCAILACLLFIASPMSGGQPGQTLRAQVILGPPPRQSGPSFQSPPSQALQGEVTLADQQSGRSLHGYSWNVRLVGHNTILHRGLNGNLGWVDDCAYGAPYYGGTHQFAGLAVLKVSDPQNPRLVDIFPGTPGTRSSQV